MQPQSPPRRSNLSPGLLGALLLIAGLAALLDIASCAAGRPPVVTPVVPEASERFGEARRAFTEAGGEERAREAAEHAAALAPDWLAPQRLLDDLARRGMGAPEALTRRLEALAADPENVTLAYLAGRLEGSAGLPRFARAVHLDAEHAWAHHGLAWMRFVNGDARGALAPGERALACAREAWERSYFAIAQARYLLAREEFEEAIALLEETLEIDGLSGFDRLEVATWLTVVESNAPGEVLRERGAQRGLRLLETSDLSAEQLRRVFGELRRWGHSVGGYRQIDAALATREGPGRRALRRDLLLELRFPELAVGLAELVPPAPLAAPPDGARADDGPRWRAARCATGDARAAIEDWLATLPVMVLDAEGMPREPRLRRLVEVARAEAGTETAIELGTAMAEAGWFEEAVGYTRELARHDREAALALHARAMRGRVLLEEIARLLTAVDLEEKLPGTWRAVADDPVAVVRTDGASLHDPAVIDSLDELLVAMQPLFDRFHGARSTAENLVASPRLAYPPAASVVHPGPRFSVADERAGRGAAGDAVGGLAAELAAIGRFGIFGQAVGGGGPDATLRRLLAIEEISGEHLGVPYSGTAVWCQGADVFSRPGRGGARITGAALHEGYWIDVASVRAEWRRWRALEERVFGEPPVEPASLLAGRGPRREWVTGTAEGAPRASLYATTGVDERIRLRVLSDRFSALDPRLPRDLVTFEELLEVVAVHEEGHLCDRTRFLPLRRHLFGALGLLADAGFSPRGVAELLEYRAQLVALCEVVDARLPLADMVEAIEGGIEVTAHASAYRGLLADLVGLLDEELDAHPQLDPDYFLVHQLHHLDRREVRELAWKLARRRGMVEE